MMSRRVSLVLVLAFLAVALPITSFAQTTGPTLVTIAGDPLKINIGSDASFQIFNSAVPGRGQIYPSSSQFGDMGIFANISGTLFAPNFTAHGGTATGGLGTYTPWNTTGISRVSGLGTSSSPFTVTINLTAPGMGVTLTVVVTYVNGQNFFRLRESFSGTRTIKVFLGADIYLASSDAGVFFVEPTFHAPGGVDCANPPTYHILLIPLSTANHLSTATFGSIWSQIGRGTLDDNATPAGCVDNGAALEWDNVALPTTLQQAVSFGEVPSAASFVPLFLTVDPDTATLFPGQSAVFTVTSGHNPDTDFNSPVTLSTPNLPDGMTAVFDHNTIPAPGDGTAKLTVTLGPDIFPATYRGISVIGTGDDAVAGAAFTIDVVCDPPVILALNNPRSQTVKRGQTATLSVKAEGPGPFSYQWFSGHAGFTSTPIRGATSSSFTTPAITTFQEFWVRVSDACGSQDSGTASLTPVD